MTFLEQKLNSLNIFLNTITFGLYKPSIDVDISAKDEDVENNGSASGIKYFDYRIIDAKTGDKVKCERGVEAKNSKAKIELNEDGYYIVEFIVYDNAGNKKFYSSIDNDTEKNIVQGAIVDNIKPEIASVTLQNPNLVLNPKNRDDSVSINDNSLIDLTKIEPKYELYYDNDVKVEISVNEANLICY